MYHVRFLKAPSFVYTDGQSDLQKKIKKQKTLTSNTKKSITNDFSITKNSSIQSSHFINFNSVITITNDLGEDFFYGDLTIQVSINLSKQFSKTSPPVMDLKSSSTKLLIQKNIPWTAGCRSVSVSVSVPITQMSHIIKSMKPYHQVFASMTLTVLEPQKIGDSLGTNLYDTFSERCLAFTGTSTPRLDSMIQSDVFQFLEVTSLPFVILTGDNYTIGKTETSSRYCVRNFPIDEAHFTTSTISIIEELGNGIERHLWNAGIYTMFILPSLLKQGSIPPQPNILELGTGVGIISIALSKIYKDARIFATDLSDAEEICNENITLNDSTAVFSTLEWTSDQRSDLLPKGAEWDLIIITDCTYNPTYYDDLIKVIKREATKDTTILIAHKIREPSGEQIFFKKFNKCFKLYNQSWIHNLRDTVQIGHYQL